MDRKKNRVAVLISNKIDFKTKSIKRETEGHFTILTGRIHQEHINIVNIYTHIIVASKYIRKFFEYFKKDKDSSTIIVGDFNTPLSIMGRSSKQNVNKGIMEQNDALDQMDLTDICRTFHPK